MFHIGDRVIWHGKFGATVIDVHAPTCGDPGIVIQIDSKGAIRPAYPRDLERIA